MRKQKLPYAYLLIIAVALALMSLPKTSSEKLRGTTIAFLAPSLQQILAAKEYLTSLSETENEEKKSPNTSEELQRLRLENTRLHTEIERFKEILRHELQLLNKLSIPQEKQQELSQFLSKRHDLEIKKLLEIKLQAIPGKVIYRSPASWNSSLWIDVGNATNDLLGQTVIAKNSPVLVGTSIVGVIDYVGTHQSRVRLLTDSCLTPAVRVLRNSSLYLAKGEVHGSSQPLWRTNSHLLTGLGFNYDFADNEGPARDLRTGKPTNSAPDAEGIPLIKAGDLLVTTGMDGVFPPDLLVAKVTKVHMLKEGDYTYELEALPTVGNLDNLSLVFVIPPVDIDSEMCEMK